jgi:hypothetical protein
MKQKTINSIVVLLIVMFCYAAVTKGHNIPLFRNQMLQSPLLPLDWIPWLSYMVPLSEFLIIALLIFDKSRIWGLYGAAYLMLSFTFYLAALLIFYGNNIPCACGGILGKLNYTVHILFNTFFSLSALTGVYLWHVANVDNKLKSSR